MARDWGVGHYETVAADLAPMAATAVEAAGISSEERVLDVACGTGNAALEALERGAEVTGVDAAPRLLEVARERAQGAGTWLEGDLAALPVPDGAFDAVLSVFGVIFAADPHAAAAELRRATRPGGRIVLATWVAEGPLAEMMVLARHAADPSFVPGAGFDWGELDQVRTLFPEDTVTGEPAAVVFTESSAAAWVARQDRDHPSWATMRESLTLERYTRLQADVTAVLEAGNEDPSAWRVTSPCLVVRVDRAG